MNYSTHTTSIHFEDVKDVLQAIRYARPLPHTSLHNYLINQHIISTRMPKPLQDYHITQWLVILITAEYNIRRQYHGLPELSADIPKTDLLNHIHDDYLMSNPELESWSVMFVRYVCLTARLSTHEHAQLAQITQRTLRRRQQQGFKQVYLHILIG